MEQLEQPDLLYFRNYLFSCMQTDGHFASGGCLRVFFVPWSYQSICSDGICLPKALSREDHVTGPFFQHIQKEEILNINQTFYNPIKVLSNFEKKIQVNPPVPQAPLRVH